jgi:hypothetical protein
MKFAAMSSVVTSGNRRGGIPSVRGIERLGFQSRGARISSGRQVMHVMPASLSSARMSSRHTLCVIE